MSQEETELRIRRARTQLVLREPFFGTLALHLQPTPVEADWCPTFATDGHRFYYASDFVDGLDDAEVEYCITHTVLHCVLDHIGRRGHRNAERWDLATDLAVNAILLAPRAKGGQGMRGPKGVPYGAAYLERSAEQIYQTLAADRTSKRSNSRGRRADTHLAGGRGASEVAGDDDDGESARGTDGEADEGSEGDGGRASGARGDRARGDRLTPAGSGIERSDRGATWTDAIWTGDAPRELSYEPDVWRRRLAGAAAAARGVGRLPAGIARMVEAELAPRLSWGELLARFISETARSDYRILPPNRRFLHQGIYLPSLGGEHIDAVVAIDTSGSIDEEQLSAFASETEGIFGAFPSYAIELIGCDAAIGARHLIEWPEPFEVIDLGGGGGTDFRPVFAHIEKRPHPPDALIYLTDGMGPFPERAPEYPVLWVIAGSDVTPPFGLRVDLDVG